MNRPGGSRRPSKMPVGFLQSDPPDGTNRGLRRDATTGVLIMEMTWYSWTALILLPILLIGFKMYRNKQT